MDGGEMGTWRTWRWQHSDDTRTTRMEERQVGRGWRHVYGLDGSGSHYRTAARPRMGRAAGSVKVEGIYIDVDPAMCYSYGTVCTPYGVSLL